MTIKHAEIMETLEGLRIESYSLERVKDGSILIVIKCWNEASQGEQGVAGGSAGDGRPLSQPSGQGNHQARRLRPRNPESLKKCEDCGLACGREKKKVSLKMDANIAFPIFEKALKKKEGKS